MIAVRTGAALAVARSGSTARRRLHRPRSGPDGRRRRRRRLGAERGSRQEGQEAQVSSVLPARPLGSTDESQANRSWLLAAFGFAAMYVPVYWWAANGIWQTDDHAHGALILAVMLWLFWGLRGSIAAVPARPRPLAGWLVFALGLLPVRGRRSVPDLDPRVRIAALRRRRHPAAAEGHCSDPRRLVRALLFHLHDPAAGDHRRRHHRPAQALDLGDRRRDPVPRSATRSRAAASC